MATDSTGQSPSQLADALYAMLREYKRLDTPRPVIAELRQYQRLLVQKGQCGAAQRELLLQALEELKQADFQAAEVLRRRFIAGDTAYAVATSTNVSESGLYVKQQEAVNKLAALVEQREAQGARQVRNQLLLRLPGSHTSPPIGVDAAVARLAALLVQPDAPFVIAVTGMGGIGKTTLLREATLHLAAANPWHGIAWVAADASPLDGAGHLPPTDEPQLSVETLLERLFDQLLPGQPKPGTFGDGKALYLLKEHCTLHRCLIVVDNLESVRVIGPLLPALRQLVHPSKVLLGSRQKLLLEADVLDFPVPELSEANALALLRSSAGGRLDWVRDGDSRLHEVFAVVGGNPQALRVVAGQLFSLDLPDVIEDLRAVHSSRIEQLYDHIYRRAWESLTRDQQKVLLTMAVVDASGAVLAYIMELAELAKGIVIDALEALVVRNLVECRMAASLLYAIHNLTRTFLYRKIVAWPGDEPET